MTKIPPSKLTIKKIRATLGHAVLLPLLNGKKFPTTKGWQNTSWEQTQQGNYQQRLINSPNTGVLLGETSGDLCTIDVDQDEWVKPFVEANPFLATALMTKGRRGVQFWLRIKGDYPRKKLTFKRKRPANRIYQD